MFKRKKLIILICCCLATITICAQQNKGTIKGRIYDSTNDVPIQSASVVIYKKKDSSIVNFQITDYKGEFNIAELPTKTPLYLIVSYTGYKSQNVSLDTAINNWDLKTINLHQNDSSSLGEVVVKAVAPIKMNGDTLEINPDAFKLDSNAVVEDMLLRVPGMVVWSDGTITMNGKKIEKLLVDGKPFFDGNTNIATQNLPKDAIKKIQLYQEKDQTKIQGIDNEKNDSLYSMNIQLKDEKKSGVFGKVSAGYGTDKRYDVSGVLQGYNPKNQIGIAFGTDNTNRTTGIGESAFVENTFKQNFMYFRYGDAKLTGIKKNIWGTAKYQHSFNETNNGQFYSRLNANYNFSNTDLNSINNTDQVDNLINYTQQSISKSNSDNSTTSHSAKISLDSRKKYGDYRSVNINLNKSDIDNQSISEFDVYRNDTSVSYNKVINNTHTTSNTISMNGFISRGDYNKENNPITNYYLNYDINYGDNKTLTHTDNFFQSYIDSIPSNTIVRNYDNRSKNFDANANLRYNGLKPLLMGIYNFYNIDFGLNNNISYSRNTQDNMVQDWDTLTHQYVTNNYLTNNNTLSSLTYKPGLFLEKRIRKNIYGKHFYYLNFYSSINHSWVDQSNRSSLLYRNIDRNYAVWSPNIGGNLYMQKFNKFDINANLSGSIDPSLPTIDQLVPIIDTSNRYNIISGNPYLKVGRRKYGYFRFSIDRSKPKAKSSYGFMIYGRYSATQNGVSDSTVYDASGKSIRYLLNMDGQKSFSLNSSINFSTKFKTKYQLQARYQPNYSNNINPGYINGILSTSHNQILTNSFTLSFIILDKFNMTLGESFTNNKNRQTGNSNLANEIKNQTTTLDATYSITKKWNISSNFNYQNNTAATNSTTASIWNATSTLRFMKDKGELKFTAFDILRQNKNIVNFLNQNSIGTTVTNGLRQYFMLSFSYFPRKFGSNKTRGIMVYDGVRL